MSRDKEVLRAGKVLSDYCKCGHLKMDHQTYDDRIECGRCNCKIEFK